MNNKTELLGKAFLEAEIRDYNEASTEGLPPYSQEYEKKMERFVKKQRNPLWKYLNSAGKRVVAASVAVVLMLGALMSVSAVRESIGHIFTKDKIQYTDLSAMFASSEGAPEVIEKEYTVGGVTDGYISITHSVDFPYLKNTCWNYEDGGYIEYNQSVYKTFSMTINTEHDDYSIIKINGHDAIYIEIYIGSKGGNMLIWDDGEYIHSLDIYPIVPYENAVKLAESLVPVNK